MDEEEFPENWWIRDQSPQSNHDAPKSVCTVCMKQPDGYTDRPDPDCRLCRGTGKKPGVSQTIQVNIQPESLGNYSDLATPGGNSGNSATSAQQVYWNTSGI